MTIFQRLNMPSLAGATAWLNSNPLGPAKLRGHPVLVNFWALTCINWLRQEPYVRAWAHGYQDDRRIVIGVHTPEYSFEHNIAGVRQATRERAIDYPVALDNDYAICFRVHARDAHIVISPGRRDPIPFRVLLDGEVPGASHGLDIDAEGSGRLRNGGCTCSCASTVLSVSRP